MLIEIYSWNQETKSSKWSSKTAAELHQYSGRENSGARKFACIAWPFKSFLHPVKPQAGAGKVRPGRSKALPANTGPYRKPTKKSCYDFNVFPVDRALKYVTRQPCNSYRPLFPTAICLNFLCAITNVLKGRRF